MKTKEDILKMNKQELEEYRWSDDFNIKKPYCSYCSDCSDCLHCSYCSDCYLCRNTKNLKYAICNVEVGEKSYKLKMKELK